MSFLGIFHTVFRNRVAGVRTPATRRSTLPPRASNFACTANLRSNACDVVLFTSGSVRGASVDPAFLGEILISILSRQLIGSMCSGALLLAALGLLEGNSATTYPRCAVLLESTGVRVVEKPFVQEGNVATAAGCLAAQYLGGWVIEEKFGAAKREEVLRSIQPVGERSVLLRCRERRARLRAGALRRRCSLYRRDAEAQR